MASPDSKLTPQDAAALNFVGVIDHSFWLRGKVVSLKNNKEIAMRNSRGHYLARPRMFNSDALDQNMNDLQTMAQAAWRGRPTLTQVTIWLEFYVSDLDSDANNEVSTVMDVLTKSGIIRDDKRRHIHQERSSWVLCPPGKEGLWVHVSGFECKEKVVSAELSKFLRATKKPKAATKRKAAKTPRKKAA